MEEDFFTDLNKRIFKYLLDAYLTKNDAHTDMDAYFTPEEIGRITKMKLSRMSLTDNGDGVLLDSIDSLKEAVRKKTSGQTNTYEELNRLLSKKREI